jgi:ribonuclease HI
MLEETLAIMAGALPVQHATMVLLNQETHHYRITGPKGGCIDLYASTQRWMVTGEPTIRGHGFDDLWAVIAERTPRPLPEAPADTPEMATIITDASHCHQTGAGGWGAWIKVNGVTGQTYSRPLKDKVRTSAEAELGALLGGLHSGVTSGLVKDGATVILQSDCQEALSVVLAKAPGASHSPAAGSTVMVRPARHPSRSLRNSPYLTMILEIVEAHRLKLIVRHVRGHQDQDTADGRGKVNHVVDRLAHDAMRIKRQQLRKESRQ